MEGNYNYSLSDLATVTGGWGNSSGNSLWFIILFFLIFNNNGWNRGGYGNGEFGTFATAASQNELLLGQKFSNLDNKIDKIGYGICDSTYALSQQMNTVQSTLGGAIVNEGRAIQTQVANATFENQKNVDSVRYDMANFANAINSNIDNKFAMLEKNQMQAQLDAQAREINQLYISQQMCNVVRWPNGMTYAASGSPFCNYPGGCGGCCN